MVSLPGLVVHLTVPGVTQHFVSEITGAPVCANVLRDVVTKSDHLVYVLCKKTHTKKQTYLKKKRRRKKRKKKKSKENNLCTLMGCIRVQSVKSPHGPELTLSRSFKVTTDAWIVCVYCQTGLFCAVRLQIFSHLKVRLCIK